MNVQSLIAHLQARFSQGLWPYTPDPAAPGLHTFGAPAAGSPVLLAGNSRHELRRLRRWLTPVGLRVLALDVGGLDLYGALAAGRLAQPVVETALRAAAEEEAAGDAPRHALLPYPAWKELGAAGWAPVVRWIVEPGPANGRDVPAFLAGGELTARMKYYRPALGERLAAAGAHVGLFLLVAAGPVVALGGLEALAMVAAGAGVSGVLVGVMWPDAR